MEVDLDGDATPIAGQTIVLKPYGGFFSTSSITDPGTPLYLTSGERDRGQIGVLVSHDNGSTWLDYAITDEDPISWSHITGSRYSDRQDLGRLQQRGNEARVPGIREVSWILSALAAQADSQHVHHGSSLVKAHAYTPRDVSPMGFGARASASRKLLQATPAISSDSTTARY